MLLVTGVGKAPESGHSGINFGWGSRIHRKKSPHLVHFSLVYPWISRDFRRNELLAVFSDHTTSFSPYSSLVETLVRLGSGSCFFSSNPSTASTASIPVDSSMIEAEIPLSLPIATRSSANCIWWTSRKILKPYLQVDDVSLAWKPFRVNRNKLLRTSMYVQ